MEAHTKTVQIVLALHDAVDHLHRLGVGIGVVQHAGCAMTGVTQNQVILTQDRNTASQAKFSQCAT